MLRIPCPHCGPSDEAEFRYRGDATVTRPPADAGVDAFHDYVFLRDNPAGWHLEWWQHLHGCRATFKVKRHTISHEIAWSGWPHEDAP